MGDGDAERAALLDATERAARWGKAVMAVASSMGAVLAFLTVTGAKVLDMPRRQDRLEARQDSLSVIIAVQRAEYREHVRSDSLVNRAQVCALKRMAESRDPSACFLFLPPEYSDPPTR